MTTSVGPQRPAVEVADVIREYGEKFLAARYGGTLTGGQRRTCCATWPPVARRPWAAICKRCGDCGHEAAGLQLLSQSPLPQVPGRVPSRVARPRARFLLPVEYHHAVFTLPQEVAAVALARPALLYDLLFRAAAATLRDVAANPKRLGPSSAC